MISDRLVFIGVVTVDSSSKLELIQVSVYHPSACTPNELPSSSLPQTLRLER